MSRESHQDADLVLRVLEGDHRAFDALTDRLQSVFRGLRGRGRITEENVSEVMREIRTALLEADGRHRQDNPQRTCHGHGTAQADP